MFTPCYSVSYCVICFVMHLLLFTFPEAEMGDESSDSDSEEGSSDEETDEEGSGDR